MRDFGKIVPFAVVGTFYFGVLIYPVLRIFGLMFPEWQPGTATLLVVLVGPLAGRLTYEWWPNPFTRVFSASTLTWLGFSFVAFMFLVPWELANLIFDLPGQASAWSLLAATALVGAGGFMNAQILAVRTVDVNAPQLVDNINIVQISDVHVGSRSSRFLARVVKRINKLSADYVFITGDLIDGRNISERELSSLANLEAPTYYIIGNHERYVDLDAICTRLGNLGVHVLRNESHTLGDIQLVGIDDAETKTQLRTVLPTIAAMPDKFRILLYHRPDGVREAAAWGAHLMLCGHTHHGQIFPVNYLVKRFFPQFRGSYQEDDLLLYISPGTGTWGPMLRLGSRSEISMIRLL
ncbi:MAG: metallophosphoesterase [Gammaproteobacteria bacterium]|nr:metallophosphoesterase [Gammaproteobacteria bacterium]